MKNSNDTIGNRTRDLLTCSAVPQPTAPPRYPFSLLAGEKNFFLENFCPVTLSLGAIREMIKEASVYFSKNNLYLFKVSKDLSYF